MSSPDKSDEALLDAFFGDRTDWAALDRLKTHFYRRLVAYFRSRGVRHPDEHDLAEEVFLRLIQTKAPYSRHDGKPVPWIFAIARNVFLDEVRKTKRRVPANDDGTLIHVADKSSGPLADLTMSEGATALATCLKSLPVKWQIAIKLLYWENLSYKEIAAVQQVPPTTVNNWIKRGKNELEQCMRSRGFDEGCWK